jgi:hypothetical protein
MRERERERERRRRRVTEGTGGSAEERRNGGTEKQKFALGLFAAVGCESDRLWSSDRFAAR